MNYFDEVVANTTVEELSVLNVLFSADSFNSYSSISNVELRERSQLSDAIYRKVIQNLVRLQFVKQQSVNKSYSYFISPFGAMVINKIIERNDSVC